MKKEIVLTEESVISKIYLIRGQRVMLDKDLAELYDVDTRDLNKAVKRNILRFPDDFRFQLNQDEFKNLMFQNGTSSWGGTRKPPSVFTEQGVAMLSSVLNSERAILVNIHIIRVFTKIRSMLLTHKDILLKLERLERNAIKHDADIKLIFQHLKELLSPRSSSPPRPIGFKLKGSK